MIGMLTGYADTKEEVKIPVKKPVTEQKEETIQELVEKNGVVTKEEIKQRNYVHECFPYWL